MTSPAARLRAPADPIQIIETDVVVVGGGVAGCLAVVGAAEAGARVVVCEKGGIIVRSPPIFGPGFNVGFDFVLSQLEKGKMPIIGNGENRIHWIHINDLIEALLLAKDRGRAGEAYLVGGKEIKTQRELLSLLAKYLKVGAPEKSVSAAVAKTMAYYKMFEARISGSVKIHIL